MSRFFDDVDAAALLLERHGRTSISGLGRHFENEPRDDTRDASRDDASDGLSYAEEIANELVVRGTAILDDGVLIATGGAEDSPINTPAKPAPDPVQRHLTVMFCDVAGSTKLAATVDPEAWVDSLRDFLSVMGAVIESWDGHIGSYLGDGLLAFFGYPVAQENAADRAVRAGLEMLSSLPDLNERIQDRIGSDIGIRIGINTGPVIVDEFRGELQATGETTNTASRVESAAPINTLAISPSTHRLVKDAVQTEDLGEYSLKGISEPLRIHQVLRLRPEGARVGAGRSVHTAMVNRVDELEALRGAWSESRNGRGQIVSLVGDAGIGKSRLVEAFREGLAEEDHIWLHAACSAYADSAAFHPIIELQKRRFGITDSDSARQRNEKISDGLKAVNLLTPRALDLIGELHGRSVELIHDADLGSDVVDVRRSETLDLLAKWLLGVAQARPTVLFFDDYHWSDPTTVALLNKLSGSTSAHPLLILATARPTRPPSWPEHVNDISIDVERFSVEHTAALARHAAGDNVPESVITSIIERSDGVPLFAEELGAAALRSDGGDGISGGIDLPDSIENLLMSRLDLGQLRQLAQAASIFGRTFNLTDLAHVCELEHHVVRELVETGVEKAFFFQSDDDQDTFEFKHALMRDAAYDSMVSKIRKPLHHRAAMGLMDQPSASLSRPDLIAEHLLMAGEPHLSSPWWQRAAEAATAQGATTEAERFYSRAVEHADPAEEALLVSLNLALAGAINSSKGRKNADISKVWADLVQLTDGTKLAWHNGTAHAGLSWISANAANFTEARESLGRARQIAESIGADDLLFGSRCMELIMSNFEGRPLEVIAEFEALAKGSTKSSPELDHAIGSSLESMMRGNAAYSLALTGRFVDAHELNRINAAAFADRSPVATTNLYALSRAVYALQSDWLQYVGQCDEYLEQAERFELGYAHTLATVTARAAHAILDPNPQRLASLKRGTNRFQGSGALMAAPFMLWLVAGAELATGQIQAAAGTIKIAESLGQSTGQLYYQPQVTERIVRVEMAGDDLGADWRGRVEESLDFARRRSLLVGALHLNMLKRDLLRGTNDEAQSRQDLGDAIDAIAQPDDAPIIHVAKALL